MPPPQLMQAAEPLVRRTLVGTRYKEHVAVLSLERKLCSKDLDLVEPESAWMALA